MTATPKDSADMPVSVRSKPTTNVGGKPLLTEQTVACSRWMHHRKGVYCGTCKQVN